VADDRPVRNARRSSPGRPARLVVWLLKFLGLWAGFAVFYSTMSVCPVCGQQGCAVGVGTSVLLGAVFSFLVMRGKRLASRLWRILFRRRG